MTKTRVPTALPSLASLRSTFPPILPIPAKSTGNNVPKSLHKTRRTWKANVGRFDLPLDAELLGRETSRGMLKGVKMTMKNLKEVEKAGGVEGLLLSRPASQLTQFGVQLRSNLFQILHEEKARRDTGFERIEMSEEELVKLGEQQREETLRLHSGR